MTITYDDKDQAAIDFAKWLLSQEDFEKYVNSDQYVWWIDLRAMKYTVEELYQIYLKHKQ